MIKINIKKFNVFTLLSLLFLIAGIAIYLDWFLRYGVAYDIGIYSLTIVLVLPGVIGTILSLLEKPDEEQS